MDWWQRGWPHWALWEQKVLVLYMRKRWCGVISGGVSVFIVSVSLKDTETEQWVSSPSALWCFSFRSCQLKEAPTEKDVFFFRMYFKSFHSNKQFKWDSAMNHQRAAEEIVLVSSWVTLRLRWPGVKPVEPVRRLKGPCVCSRRVGVASV